MFIPVVVQVDAVFDANALNEKEEAIVEAYGAIIQAFGDRTPDSQRRMMAVLQERFPPASGLRVLPVLTKEGSVRLYFLCSSLEALQLLRDLVESGQLKVMLEDFFNFLLADVKVDPIKLKMVYLPDYWMYVDYFKNSRGMLRSISNCYFE